MYSMYRCDIHASLNVRWLINNWQVKVDRIVPKRFLILLKLKYNNVISRPTTLLSSVTQIRRDILLRRGLRGLFSWTFVQPPLAPPPQYFLIKHLIFI